MGPLLPHPAPAARPGPAPGPAHAGHARRQSRPNKTPAAATARGRDKPEAPCTEHAGRSAAAAEQSPESRGGPAGNGEPGVRGPAAAVRRVLSQPAPYSRRSRRGTPRGTGRPAWRAAAERTGKQRRRRRKRRRRRRGAEAAAGLGPCFGSRRQQPAAGAQRGTGAAPLPPYGRPLPAPRAPQRPLPAPAARAAPGPGAMAAAEERALAVPLHRPWTLCSPLLVLRQGSVPGCTRVSSSL